MRPRPRGKSCYPHHKKIDGFVVYAYRFVTATLKCRQIVYDAGETDTSDDMPCPAYVGKFLLNNFEKEYVQAFAIFGGALGILSFILQFLTAGYSLASRRKQIGVLQSLGAGRKDIYLILLGETAVMSFAIFIIALPLSLGVYWHGLFPILYDYAFKVALLYYSVWNGVILAGMSFIVPMFATCITAKQFLRYSPIENIRRTNKKKLARENREEAKRQRDLKKLQKLKDKYEKK